MPIKIWITLAAVACLWPALAADVTDSLACLAGNDGTLIIRESGVYGVDYTSDYYMAGDAWNWFDMYRYALEAYISFPVANVPPGQQLASATLHCYVAYCAGNSSIGEYPVFDFPSGSFPPHCQLTHVDYGNQVDAADYDAVILHPPLNLFNSYLPGWNELDVTACVADDIQVGREYTQFQIKLQLLTDWDNGDDYVVFYGAEAANYNPWLEVEFCPGSPAQDAVRPSQRLTAFPNPFRTATRIEFVSGDSRTEEAMVFNQRGQLVRRLDLAGKFAALEWDGRDSSGRSVTPGIYLFRLTGNQPGQTLKVVKLP